MATIDDLLEQAKRLTPAQRRELRDRLAELTDLEKPQATKGLYASFLGSAGSGHALAADVARNKQKHLAEIYATKRRAR